MRMSWTAQILSAAVLLALPVSSRAEDAPPPPPTNTFFDLQTIHEIRLAVKADEWEKIRYQTDNTYYKATFVWGVSSVPVEIRQKGNTSRNPFKPSIKLKFPKASLFYGVRYLELKSNVQDPTQMKQAITMQAFAKMGLLTPRETHARVFVNDQLMGLYLVTEYVDENFLERHVQDASGALYDFHPTPEYRFEDLGWDEESYLTNFQLESPRDADSRPLIDMIKAINNTKYEDFVAKVGEYLDWDQFLTYLASEMYFADSDGVAGNTGMNNFYLYFWPKQKRFIFIPVDRDSDFALVDWSLFQNFDKNVLLRKMLDHPELKQKYFEKVMKMKEICGGEGGWLQGEIAKRTALLADAIAEDPNKQCENASCTMSRVEDYQKYVYFFAAERPKKVTREAESAGYQPPPPPPASSAP